MNELIEQLVAHATSIQGPGPFNPLSFETFDKERFAQLIVAECEAYVSDRFDSHEPWMRPGDLSRHFGI